MSKRFLIIIAVLLTACHRKDADTSADAQIRARLVGTWTINWGQSTNFAVRGVLALSPDGTSSCRLTNRWKSGQREFAYEATWQIKTGALVFTYTKTSQPQEVPVGTTESVRILRLTDTSFDTFDQTAHQTNTFTRQGAFK